MQTTAATPAVTPDQIFQLATGYMASKMLFTAGAIDLFAQLADGPQPAEAVAARLKLPLRSVRVVADAMIAVGLLALDGDRYVNTDVAQTYLSGRAPADMRPLLKFWDPTRMSPVMAALMSGEFLVQTQGRSYSAAEVSGWLEQTGWRTVEHRPLAGPVSLLIGETSN